jgi:hypothetical protein
MIEVSKGIDLNEIYEGYHDKEQLILSEGSTSWKVIGHRLGDSGIETYLEGASFPKKGLYTGQAIWSINLIKSMIIEPVKLISWYFIPSFVLFALLPKGKFLNKLIKSFNRIGWRIMSVVILKAKYMVNSSKEVKKFIYNFSVKMGLDEQEAIVLSKILSHILEYDTAYRFRFEDIMSETTKNRLLKDLKGEVDRLYDIFIHRENGKFERHKLSKLMKVVSYLLLHPKIKKCFIYALEQSQFSNFQYDEADAYWCMQREEYYNYMGQTNSQRISMLKLLGYSIPKAYPNEEILSGQIEQKVI